MNPQTITTVLLWIVGGLYCTAMIIWAIQTCRAFGEAGNQAELGTNQTESGLNAGNIPEFDMNADARRRTRALKRGKKRPFRIVPQPSRSGFLRLEPIVPAKRSLEP